MPPMLIDRRPDRPPLGDARSSRGNSCLRVWWRLPVHPKGILDIGLRRRIQPFDATHSLNISAGVWKPSVLRGLSFNCRAIALS